MAGSRLLLAAAALSLAHCFLSTAAPSSARELDSYYNHARELEQVKKAKPPPPPQTNLFADDPRLSYEGYVTLSVDHERARFDRSPLAAEGSDQWHHL